jgi:hypothetical protein
MAWYDPFQVEDMLPELSSEARERVRRLALPLVGKDETIGIVLELATLGETAAIPVVAPYLAHRDAALASAAAAAVNHLLGCLPPAGLPDVDSAVRELRNSYQHRPWLALEPGLLASFEHFGQSAVPALGIASCHHDGYVREQAVRRLAAPARRLATRGEGRELPFLLIRMNDWVSQVATAAAAAVDARLRQDVAETWIPLLPLLVRLGRLTRRKSLAAVLERVTALLRAPDNAILLVDAFTSAPPGVRREILAIALGTSAWPLVLERAMTDRDVVVRLRAARHLAALPDPATRRRLLDAAARDRFLPVRREALTLQLAAAALAGALQESDLAATLLDRDPAIRHLARRELAKLGAGHDAAAFYRRALAARQAPIAALTGLAETGKQADAALALPWTGEASSRLRATAVRTLAKLDAPAHLPALVDLARVGSPRVAREAGRALAANTHLLRIEQIWAALESAAAYNRTVLSAVLERFSKWDTLPYLLTLAYGDEPAPSARAALKRWDHRFNRSFVQPSAEQRQRILVALEAFSSRIEPRAWRECRHMLGFRD